MAESTAAKPKVRCDACPVVCNIAEGRSGACDRYGNQDGQLVRLDPLTILQKTADMKTELVPFLAADSSASDHSLEKESSPPEWDGRLIQPERMFVTAIGAGTTYPDYKPAPFIVSSEVDGVDMITVVTEGIFSYCGVKVKIDTDRHIGPERSLVRVDGEPVGHVTTGEYGSQMLSLGGVNHLTGGSKKEGRVTCATLLALCNRESVELVVDEGSTLILRAGVAPVIDGVSEQRMRVGCGSATIGMFASQWQGLVDEVVVVDDHITGVVSEHQAGKVLGWQPSGINIFGRRSTPGRYFQVAQPGKGWGGTDLTDPLLILDTFKSTFARPGLSLLMVSTTGEHAAYFELNDDLKPVPLPMPARLKPSIELIEENCEPASCSVMFMGGAGGSLRSGATRNPVQLTRSVNRALTRVTCGGAPAYVWPGGGITLMADVTQMPDNAFGYVPTPALVAPIEFTMTRDDYQALGGHMEHIVSLADAVSNSNSQQNDHVVTGHRQVQQVPGTPWPLKPAAGAGCE